MVAFEGQGGLQQELRSASVASLEDLCLRELAPESSSLKIEQIFNQNLFDILAEADKSVQKKYAELFAGTYLEAARNNNSTVVKYLNNIVKWDAPSGFPSMQILAGEAAIIAATHDAYDVFAIILDEVPDSHSYQRYFLDEGRYYSVAVTAAANRDQRFIQKLLDLDYEFYSEDSATTYVLQSALRAGHAGILADLITDKNLTINRCHNFLEQCCCTDSVKGLRIFFRRFAKQLEKRDENYSQFLAGSLYSAVQFSGIDLIKEFLPHLHDACGKDAQFVEQLGCAALWGKSKIVNYLLAETETPPLIKEFSESALAAAIQGENYELFKDILGKSIEYYGELTASDDLLSGLPLNSLAKRAVIFAIRDAKVGVKQKIIRYLFSEESQLCFSYSDIKDCLSFAVEQDDLDSVKTLLELSEERIDIKELFFLTTKKENSKTFKFFCEEGYLDNLFSSTKTELFYLAIERGATYSVKRLIKAGVDYDTDKALSVVIASPEMSPKCLSMLELSADQVENARERLKDLVSSHDRSIQSDIHNRKLLLKFVELLADLNTQQGFSALSEEVNEYLKNNPDSRDFKQFVVKAYFFAENFRVDKKIVFNDIIETCIIRAQYSGSEEAYWRKLVNKFDQVYPVESKVNIELASWIKNFVADVVLADFLDRNTSYSLVNDKDIFHKLYNSTLGVLLRIYTPVELLEIMNSYQLNADQLINFQKLISPVEWGVPFEVLQLNENIRLRTLSSRRDILQAGQELDNCLFAISNREYEAEPNRFTLDCSAGDVIAVFEDNDRNPLAVIQFNYRGKKKSNRKGADLIVASDNRVYSRGDFQTYGNLNVQKESELYRLDRSQTDVI